MRFTSTRGGDAPVTLSTAIARGLAPDGGLYVPESLPVIDVSDWDPDWSLARIAEAFLRPFFADDPLADQLEAITASALNVPLPVTQPFAGRDDWYVLELFHGATAAFKDFGARFLAECLCRLRAGQADPFTVLVATSGDTGGAVGAAFDGRNEARVVILFPEGRVSPLQRHQLTCWSDRVLSLEVTSDFDACQGLSKAAFADPDLSRHFQLTSANSINIARLLAQMTYYAALTLRLGTLGRVPVNVIVPTGNVGNALSALWVKAMGLPIGRVICASNANRTMPDFLATGRYEPRPSVATLANAMDVGAPSNAERLMRFLELRPDLRASLSAAAVDDDQIRARIKADFDRDGIIWCPHSATAAHLLQTDHPDMARPDRGVWCVAATAHAAKFPEVVEPIIGTDVPRPPALAALADRPSRARPLPADLQALGTAMRTHFVSR
ncbi:MAG: threonine synthase [Alphaproteobacteria bacterium]